MHAEIPEEKLGWGGQIDKLNVAAKQKGNEKEDVKRAVTRTDYMHKFFLLLVKCKNVRLPIQ
jgi:hypothetical protein